MEINLTEPGMSKRERHELFMSIVTPRPIAWISTIGGSGVANVAPFSAYGMGGLKPATVVVNIGYKRDGRKKDTLRNIESSGEFVINAVTEELLDPMNISCDDLPPDVSEFDKAGVTPVPSKLIRAPRVAESPVSMECRVRQIIVTGEPPDGGHMVIGEVLIVHIRDDLWTGECVDQAKLRAVARMGGDFYCRTRDMFELLRPFKD